VRGYAGRRQFRSPPLNRKRAAGNQRPCRRCGDDRAHCGRQPV